MRDHLICYIDLLFAGAPEAVEIKQEILQNTLDRFDDLLAQGKTPEAAYQLAISGIGDISEILSTQRSSAPVMLASETAKREKPVWKKVLQSIGICLYILCPIPLFVLQNEFGLCGLLAFVAVATAMMVFSGGKEKKVYTQEPREDAPQLSLRKAIGSVIFAVGLCVYLGLSFITQAWYITWVIFPLMAAVKGLVNACMDLKEANDNEK